MAVLRISAAASAVAAAAALTAPAAAPTVDRWLLDGHGAGRALFASPPGAKPWLTPAPQAGCSQLTFYTPFSSYAVAAGMGVRDAAGQAPLLAIPLQCGSAGTPTAWVLDPTTGATVSFGPLGQAASVNSYVKFLPDGTFAVGTTNADSNSVVAVYDPATLGNPVYTNAAVVAGDGGAQVLAVTKPGPGGAYPAQLQVAGGSGGPDWWGAAVDLPSDAATQSFPWTNAAGNADSTVCMGADGRSMFNNQRFESPAGVTRFVMPFPSSPESYNTGGQQWPWQMRSSFDGRVAALNDNVLTMYAAAAGHASVWSVPGLYSGAPATLTWTDDEALVVFANATSLISLDAATGAVVASVDLTAPPLNAAGCGAQQSPWSIPTPAPLSDGRVVLVCSGAGSRLFVAVVNAATGKVTPKTAPLAFPPAQVVVDSSGAVYAVGVVAAKKGQLSVQRVAAPAMEE
jgi:hypothetical protein